MAFTNKKPHRLPLASMSTHYVEARKAEFEMAYNYAQGRRTSMGMGALIQERQTPTGRKRTGLASQTKMFALQIMTRLFSHRKM